MAHQHPLTPEYEELLMYALALHRSGVGVCAISMATGVNRGTLRNFIQGKIEYTRHLLSRNTQDVALMPRPKKLEEMLPAPKPGSLTRWIGGCYPTLRKSNTRVKYSIEQVQKAVDLCKQGATRKEASRLAGVNEEYLIAIMRKHSVRAGVVV